MLQIIYYIILSIAAVMSIFSGTKKKDSDFVEVKPNVVVPAPPVEPIGSPIGATGSSGDVVYEGVDFNKPFEVSKPNKNVTEDIIQRAVNVRIGFNYGTGTFVGPSTIYTCSHIADNPTNQCEVAINNRWVRATFTASPTGDFATVQLNQPQQFPPLSTVVPKYGDKIYVYGMYSKKVMEGTLAYNNMVTLNPDEPGILQGDSGGGVFSEDGSYIGAINYTRGGNLDPAQPEETRLIYFTAAPTQGYSSSGQINGRSQIRQGYTNTSPITPQVPVQQNCQNGICTPVQQYRGRNGRLFFFK